MYNPSKRVCIDLFDYQELMTSRESNWERLRADYESRILRLETELSTAKR